MQLVKENILPIVFGAVSIACFWKGVQRPEWLAGGVIFAAIALLMFKKRDA